MVEKRNRLRVTREGSLLGVLIDVEISDQDVAVIRALLKFSQMLEDGTATGAVEFIEPIIDDGTDPEMRKYQADSR